MRPCMQPVCVKLPQQRLRGSLAGHRFSHRFAHRLTTSATMPNIVLDAITAAAKEVNGTFCCGGDLQLSAPIKLFVCDDKADTSNERALVLSLPAAEEQIPALLSACQQASFGRGSQAVQDPAYRSALCLDPADFSTNFGLERYGILSTIKTLMMPQAVSPVTAELYKLNVYRPGDFFKSHVDTPRGAGMFGSLVICLPQPHTGGQLRLQQQQQKKQKKQQSVQVHEFDWGTNSSHNTVQWAAFYSDSPHEILPVASGHRITLTYNLHLAPAATTGDPALPGLSASSMALHAALKAALADPDFMPTGGTLGFACEHAYPHTQEGLCDGVASMLKGGDAALLVVAHALGLTAEVRAVHDMEPLLDFFLDEADKAAGEVEGAVDELRLSAFSPVATFRECDQYMSRGVALQQLFEGSDGGARVTWCRRPSRWALQLASAAYGNEPTVREWYSAAAVLVTVPDSSSRKVSQ